MASPVVKWHWTYARLQAAYLIARNELSDMEIAEQFSISTRQLSRWKATKEFQERVAHWQARRANAASGRAIAKLERRIAELDKLWLRCLGIIDQRAADPSMKEVPGGSTGLVVRGYKSLGSGDNARIVEEYKVDTALTAEIRAIAREAAEELGQRGGTMPPAVQANVQVNVNGSQEERRASLDATQEERLEALRQLLPRLAAEKGIPMPERPGDEPEAG
jgi:hypothetical protein